MLIPIFLALTIQEPGDWAEILRDAQVNTKAALRYGRASMELTYTPSKMHESPNVIIQSEITWSGEKFLQRIRAYDPKGLALAQTWNEPLIQARWDSVLFDGTTFFFHNGDTSILFIEEGRLPRDLNPLTDFHPWRSWLACCPPTTNSGRPWEEMLRFADATGDGRKSTLEFQRVGTSEVKQVRRDPNGGMLEAFYSLEHGGNIVRFSFEIPDFSYPRSEGVYRWRRLGTSYVLDDYEVSESHPTDHSRIDSLYRLKVKSVDLRPVDPSLLTRASFERSLPPLRQIQDRRTNRVTQVEKVRPDVRKSLRDLSQTLRSRGFATPD